MDDFGYERLLLKPRSLSCRMPWTTCNHKQVRYILLGAVRSSLLSVFNTSRWRLLCVLAASASDGTGWQHLAMLGLVRGLRKQYTCQDVYIPDVVPHFSGKLKHRREAVAEQCSAGHGVECQQTYDCNRKGSIQAASLQTPQKPSTSTVGCVAGSERRLGACGGATMLLSCRLDGSPRLLTCRRQQAQQLRTQLSRDVPEDQRPGPVVRSRES